MIDEMNRTKDLWVHQESAIIVAESHDVWSFTPEFLLVNEIVPSNWTCRRARRTGNSIDIQYGPVHWRMTENDLWITHFPDCPIEDRSNLADGRIVPTMAESYLGKVPYSPFRRLWCYWRISAIHPERHRWMLGKFLHHGLPEEFNLTGIQPSLYFTSESVAFQLTVRTDSIQRQFETVYDSIVFDCYAYGTEEQTVSDMVLETNHWIERRNSLERVIGHLLEEGN